MIESKELTRTNYVKGIRISPNDFKKTDNFHLNQFKILALGGLGEGIILGFKDSLAPSIQGNLLIIKSGAAVDKDGNIIYLPISSVPIKEDLNIVNFLNKTTTYIYIKYDEKLDNLRDDKTGQQQVYTEIISTYKIEISNTKYENSEWIELGRIYIDYDKISQDSKSHVTEALNPFKPVENELDISLRLNIETNRINLRNDDKKYIYDIFKSVGNYLLDISFKYKILSASISSSYIFGIKNIIYNSIITPYKLDIFLRSSVEIMSNIAKEKEEIKNEEFWKNIERIKKIFDSKLKNEFVYKVDFFNIHLQDKDSYFYKIMEHFKRASKSIDTLSVEIKEKKEEQVHRGFIQIGRSDKAKDENDISYPDDKSISRIHLYVTTYKGGFFIEDVSTNGTFVNSQKIEKGVKQFVTQSDTITLGTKNTILNLNIEIIQKLLTL